MGEAFCGGMAISQSGSVMAQNMMAPPTPEQKIIATQEVSRNSGFSSGSPNLMSP